MYFFDAVYSIVIVAFYCNEIIYVAYHLLIFIINFRLERAISLVNIFLAA